MTLDLDELERLEKAATPGTWRYRHSCGDDFLECLDEDGEPVHRLVDAGQLSKADAALIAAMRNALPALIAQAREAERLRRYLSVGLHSVEAVRHVMGDDVPAAGDHSDIPWIKRLREKTGCGLSQAKAAHDLLRLHARAEALEAENKRLSAVSGEYDDLIRHMCAGGDFHEFMVSRAALSATQQPAEAKEP